MSSVLCYPLITLKVKFGSGGHTDASGEVEGSTETPLFGFGLKTMLREQEAINFETQPAHSLPVGSIPAILDLSATFVFARDPKGASHGSHVAPFFFLAAPKIQNIALHVGWP